MNKKQKASLPVTDKLAFLVATIAYHRDCKSLYSPTADYKSTVTEIIYPLLDELYSQYNVLYSALMTSKILHPHHQNRKKDLSRYFPFEPC